MYTTAPSTSKTAPLDLLEGETFAPPKGTRGAARRLLLLQTTLRLISDRGVDAVSHRSVAELAEVPLGSTTYWFASRQEMLSEALEYFARVEIESLRKRLAGVLGQRLSASRLVDEFTAFLIPQLGEERWRTVAQYALLGEAVRRPELEQVCREWTDAWREVLSEVFESLGAESPAQEARSFLALLDGLLLGQLAAPDADVEQSVIRPALTSWFSRFPGSSR